MLQDDEEFKAHVITEENGCEVVDTSVNNSPVKQEADRCKIMNLKQGSPGMTARRRADGENIATHLQQTVCSIENSSATQTQNSIASGQQQLLRHIIG